MNATLNADQQIVITALSVSGPRPTPPRRERPQRAAFATDDEFEAATVAAKSNYDVAFAAYGQALEDYGQSLKANARDIKVMLGERSEIIEQLVVLDKVMDKDADGGKVFVGTIVRVKKEETSKRGLIYLHTGTEQVVDGLPLGQELVRTERTDTADGRALARSAQLLLGHRVVVYIENQKMKNNPNRSVRVLKHIEDKGIDSRFDAAAGTVAS